MTFQVTKPAGRKVLYFCPATMIDNVKREAQRWAPHRSVVVLGGQSKVARKFLLDAMTEHPEYLVVINYEASRKDNSLIEDLINLEFDTCIIDEAHNIKDRSSKAYRDIKKLLSLSSIPFVIPMTGTPILNRPQELFSLLTLVDPYHFNSENYFLRDYCQQDIYTGKWRFKPGGVDRLFKQFPNLFLRRTKEQAGIVLPPKTITIHEIEIDEQAYPMQAEARMQMRDWGSIMLDPDAGKAISAAAQIAIFTRLRQIETWPAGIEVKDKEGNIVLSLREKYGESQKLDEIIHWENSTKNEWLGLIPEITRHAENNSDGERTVVFSQFKEPLREIARRAESAGYKVAVLDGETPESVRQEIAIDFDNKYANESGWGKFDLVLCNYKVGGVGLNLTAATQMIVLDEEWNPGKRDQAYDRIHRMGQDKPVTIHVLRTKYPPGGITTSTGTKTTGGGGIDVWLASIIEEKQQLVDGFNEAADSITGAGFEALKNGLI